MTPLATSASAILVVEDDPNDRELLEVALRAAGWNRPIQFFGNGAELIDYFRTASAYGDRCGQAESRLLFLDLNTPQVDGCGVIAWLRRQFPSPAIRIIVLSGSGDSEGMRHAAALGADRLLLKPPSEPALRAEIERLDEPATARTAARPQSTS